MKKKYLVTGNEAISLPCIDESNGAIGSFTFLHMGLKGMVEVKGTDRSPFLRPFVIVNGKEKQICDLKWSHDACWIPKFSATVEEIKIEGTILAPIGERGFIYRIRIINKAENSVSLQFGLKGCWGDTLHTINESKEIEAKKHVYNSGWNHSIVFDMRIGVSLFSFAPALNESVACSYSLCDSGVVVFELKSEAELTANQEICEDFFFGLGYEEVAACTSAKEMLRQGFENEYDKTYSWLQIRAKSVGDIELDGIMNLNMFFSFFFGSGITLDSEELVLVTSRSPRYYVSAAYWDRDSLLWSFPAILMTDVDHARNMLEYVFSKQIRNIGIHSRFIDGTVLEPGFELDELCAPIIALSKYVSKSGDTRYLSEPHVISGVERILKILASKKHPEINLYETMLQPTDDMHVYKYITYDNVLVWHILTILFELFRNIWDSERIEMLKTCAKDVKEALYKNCVKDVNGQSVFAWSVDLKGKFDVYDEPPGSLLLLPYYGFCGADDAVYKNTVELIKRPEYPYSFDGFPISEIGCPHAPHPWILSIANSLLCGYKDSARTHLLKCNMDNGIACESVDEYTGESATGDAFATCAGFLAYSIYHAFGYNTIKERGIGN